MVTSYQVFFFPNQRRTLNMWHRHTLCYPDHTHRLTLSTSVADSLLSPLSLPTPESQSCFFCCSMSSTLPTHFTGYTSNTLTAKGGVWVCVWDWGRVWLRPFGFLYKLSGCTHTSRWKQLSAQIRSWSPQMSSPELLELWLVLLCHFHIDLTEDEENTGSHWPQIYLWR